MQKKHSERATDGNKIKKRTKMAVINKKTKADSIRLRKKYQFMILGLRSFFDTY